MRSLFAAIVLALACSHSFAAPPQWCQEQILALAQKSVGWGFVEFDAVRSIVSGWGHSGLNGSANSLFFGNIYLCPSCRRPNGSHDRSGKFVDCKGCGSPINKATHVHEIYDQSGRRLIHLESIFYGGNESLADGIRRPWNCAYCGKHNLVTDATCKSCGADPYAGHPKKPDEVLAEIPYGARLTLIPDSSEFDGYRLEVPKRKGPTQLAVSAATQVRRVVERATGKVTYEREPTPPAPPLVEFDSGVLSRRGPRFTRRQLVLGSLASLAVGIPLVRWSLTPYVPDLPPAEWHRARVVKRNLVRSFRVLHRDGDKLTELQPLTTEKEFDAPEGIDSPGMIEWPVVDEARAANTRDWRHLPHQEFSLEVETANYRITLALSPEEIAQYRVGDDVEVYLDEGGSAMGIRRVGGDRP